MNLLAHVTIHEGAILIGTFACGLLSGAFLTWMVFAAKFRKN